MDFVKFRSRVLAGGTGKILSLAGRPRFRPVWILLPVLIALVVAAALRRPSSKTEVSSAVPDSPGSLPLLIERPTYDVGFVSSQACQKCHQDQYESWYATYHRTMTQEATPEAVIPDWDGLTLESRGRTYHLERQGDEFWVEMPDPTWELQRIGASISHEERGRIPRVRERIAMTTGSHHHQTYWVQNPRGPLIQFPWVYHIADQKWVFRIDSFLMPPTDQVSWRVWNLRCIACHSTGGQPRVDPHQHTMLSRAGELGIACEACHGPGREHVTAQRNTGHRTVENIRPNVLAIVNPMKCTPERASQICGQCHSFSRHKDMEQWLQTGDTYRAGDDLLKTREIDYFTEVLPQEWQDDPLVHDPAYLAGRFWRDGTVRTGGREYNGLINSPCYKHGEGERMLSCLSCHSMHESDPDDLLAVGMEGDRACTQCHAEPQFTDRIQDHTHHRADSSGSRCYNCHMPFTTYALFRGIRSHRVDSPRVANTTQTGRPVACNLCHLNQTLEWTSEYLATWYSHGSVELSQEEQTTSAAVRWALRGDAVQRVIAAWNMGWDDAQEVSGTQWLVPFLAQLLVDPYPAVRKVAWHSLREIPEYADLTYGFDGPARDREGVRAEVLARWNRRPYDSPAQDAASRLLTRDGKLQQDRFRQLLQQRDDRPIIITE